MAVRVISANFVATNVVKVGQMPLWDFARAKYENACSVSESSWASAYFGSASAFI
jgi:hypothetical protein